MRHDNYPEIGARIVLTIAVCAMAWAFGGVEPIAKVWAARLVGLAAVLLLLAKPSLTFGTRALPTVWLVLGLAAGLAFLQLADLGASAVETLSPNAVATRMEQGSSAGDIGHLTVAEPETRRDLSLLLVGIAAFVIASQVFHSVGSQLFLSFSVAINGAALSAWGLVQQLNNSNELLPGVRCDVNSIIFSTYVNHSSAAGLLNMCLGAAVGLFLWRYRSTSSSSDYKSPGEMAANLLRSLTPLLLLLSAMTTLIIAALGASLSRGGCLATLVAFVVTLIIMRRRSGSTSFNASVISVGIGVAALVWIGFAEPLANRYAAMMSQEGGISDSRFDHWSDGLRAATNFPLTGSGLGTYSSIYLMFEENSNPHWFRHAHNQYLEALVDGGVIGLLLMLITIALVAKSAWHLCTNREIGVHAWFGIGVAFLLVSQIVHAVSDFGLYLPANMLLCAVMCGAVCGSAASTSKSKLQRMPAWISRPIMWNVLVFAGCVFAMNHLQAMEHSNQALAKTALETRTSQRLSVEQINERLTIINAAIRLDASNADLRFRKARLLLLRYQTLAFKVLRDNDGFARSEHELWTRASPEHLHAALLELNQEDRDQQIGILMKEPIVQANLVSARDELLAARTHNPFRARFHVYLAILGPLFGESDLDHLDRAESIASTDAETSFDCGLLHLRANRTTRAIESWRQCFRFSRERADLALSLGQGQLDDETLVMDVLPADPVLLVRLAEARAKVNPDSPIIQRLAERVLSMNNSKSSYQDDYFRGRAATLIGDEALAAKWFGEAVREYPNQAEWRFRYADALTKSGRIEEAKTQLQWCLGVAPENVKYQQLMHIVKLRSQASGL